MNLKRIAEILDNKNDLVIREVVLDTAQKKNQIIYGSRAYNAQVPNHLKKVTTDYDILTSSPKKSAEEVAETLSRRLGKKVEVVNGTHKGTYRIKIDSQTVADYTQLKTKPKTKKVWGNEFRDLKSIKRNATRLSNNPNLSYRKEKDLATIRGIREVERIDRLLNI